MNSAEDVWNRARPDARATRPDAPARARLGLHVERRATAPGEVVLEPAPEHRIRIHAGPPLRSACRRSQFVYTRGDVDIHPANGAADRWTEADPSELLMLRLTPALLRRAAEDLGMDPDRAGLEERHQLRDPKIEHIAWALDGARADGASDRLYIESLGLALAVHLLGSYRAIAPVVHGLSREQLGRVTDYIESHLDRDLSLARIAGVAGVGATQLKTLFRRSVGVPVHAYVVQRRVERAKALLLRGDLPASQIALDAGFAHQSHMARCMQRVLGMTPRSLVRQARF